jgi:DNA-directed RNA polymerase specialized sigma54-like protein
MTLTANEARNILDAAKEEEIAKKRAEAEEFCNGLEDTIKACAEKQCNHTDLIEAPRAIINYIVQVLKDNGFDVKISTNTATGRTSIGVAW